MNICAQYWYYWCRKLFLLLLIMLADKHVWCMCVCVSRSQSLSLSLTLSLASDSLETIKVFIIKFGTVTASDMIIHHSRSHKYCTNYFIISESFRAMPITFAVKTSKCLYNLFLVWWPWRSQRSKSQLCLKVDKCFNLYFNGNISEATAFKLGMKVDLCMGYLMVIYMTLTLM